MLFLIAAPLLETEQGVQKGDVHILDVLMSTANVAIMRCGLTVSFGADGNTIPPDVDFYLPDNPSAAKATCTPCKTGI